MCTLGDVICQWRFSYKGVFSTDSSTLPHERVLFRGYNDLLVPRISTKVSRFRSKRTRIQRFLLECVVVRGDTDLLPGSVQDKFEGFPISK